MARKKQGSQSQASAADAAFAERMQRAEAEDDVAASSRDEWTSVGGSSSLSKGKAAQLKKAVTAQAKGALSENRRHRINSFLRAPKRLLGRLSPRRPPDVPCADRGRDDHARELLHHVLSERVPPPVHLFFPAGVSGVPTFAVLKTLEPERGGDRDDAENRRVLARSLRALYISS